MNYTPQMISISEAIVEFLATQETSYVFGKVGEDLLPLLDCIARQKSVEFISLYRAETAALIADGYARVSDKPGIVLVSGGPGAAQTLAAMAQAYYDGSPVILLSTELPATYLGREESATHGLDQEPLFRRVTLSSGRIHNPKRVVSALEQAYRCAMSGKKGPVYCGIPSDFLRKETPEMISHHSRFMTPNLPTADPTLVHRACELLVSCQTPVILLGGGAVWSKASPEAMELAEFLFAPIVSTSGKSGIVPDDYPLSIGRLGSKANKVALQTVAAADVIIAFGCSFNDRTTLGFSTEIFSPNVKIIQVDIDPRSIGRNYPIELGIVGDAKMVLKEILSVLRKMGAEKWPSRVIQRIQKVWELKETWSGEWARLARSSEIPIRRLRILKDLVDELGRDVMIFGDLPWKHCLQSSFSPLVEADDFAISGAHLGLAIGAALGQPSRPVVAVLGDGEFMAAISDLATAVEHRIPVLTVIARNNCYGRAKAVQTQFYEGRYIGVDHPFPNMADLALSLGAFGERVESPANLRPAIRRAIESQTPALIEVVVSDSIRDLKPVFE